MYYYVRNFEENLSSKKLYNICLSIKFPKYVPSFSIRSFNQIFYISEYLNEQNKFD